MCRFTFSSYFHSFVTFTVIHIVMFRKISYNELSIFVNMLFSIAVICTWAYFRSPIMHFFF